jgi:hypothetical protein
MARIDIKSNGTGGGGGSGTVTSVSIATGTSGTNVNATGTVTTAGTLTVNIPTASATNTGKLSNTDWSTFNGKQAALVSGTNIKTINGSSVLGAGDLTVTGTPAGATGNIQFNNAGAFGGENNLFWDDTNNRLGINTTTPGNALDVHAGADVVGTFNRTGSGSAFHQYALAGANKWRTGYDNTAGSFVIYDVVNTTNRVVVTNTGEFDLQGNKLQNFSADVETLAANTTFDASNTATYNGRVIQVSGARTFTFDNALPIGFSATFIQTSANSCSFVGAGSVVINNRQGHSSNNGQYSVVSIVKINTLQFILGGDTA